MSVPRRYWDSSVALAWLLPEQERRGACKSVIRAAERGEVQIVTSSITLTEVVKLKGSPTLTKEHEAKLRGFFLHQYILVREVDRFTAEEARELIWRYGLAPKDSIHVATALRAGMTVLDTFDKDLLKLSKKLGDPLLEICEPHMPGNLDLFDDQNEQD
jgi:predicted nucleic acid-binding protein